MPPTKGTKAVAPGLTWRIERNKNTDDNELVAVGAVARYTVWQARENCFGISVESPDFQGIITAVFPTAAAAKARAEEIEYK